MKDQVEIFHYALNSAGKLVYIDADDVLNGKACNCTCPHCHQPVVAKNKGEIRDHHFAHANNTSDCKGAKMAVIHLLAQQIIQEEKCVMLPDYYQIPSQQKHFKEVRLEVHDKELNLRPDIICEDESGNMWSVEICNTHSVHGAREEKYKNQNVINCLEIDVSEQEEDKEKLKDFLLNSTGNRKWFNTSALDRQLEEMKKAEEEKLKKENGGLGAFKPFDICFCCPLHDAFSNCIYNKGNFVVKNKKFIFCTSSDELIQQAIAKKNVLKGKSNYICTSAKQDSKTAWKENIPEFFVDKPLDNDALLKQLNKEQQNAVKDEGSSLIIAVAGSGKTRVLTYKIAYLLNNGIAPWNILALTFTNKAARVMRERIAKLVGSNKAKYLYMGTFHSVVARLLRAQSARIGYNPNFTIYDETDSRSLIKAIVKGMNLDEKQYKPSTVHNRISMAKNHLITAEAYAIDRSALQRDQETKMPAMSAIYSAYQARMQQANAMDFDDLLLNTYILLSEHVDIRNRYREQFQYIFIDEYQDTNKAQHQIILQLKSLDNKICAVGDDSQSIYSFRGANIDNILSYADDIGGTKYFLVHNYRSTRRIIQAADSVISQNKDRIQDKPFDDYNNYDEGERITYKPAYSDKEEALIVCKDIQRIKRQDGCEYSDFAILYRTNAQSRAFEEEMRRQAIPYRIYGGLSFYQRKEIKDVIAYFRLVANPDDEEAFRRIINYPTRGIGNTTIQKIQDCAQDNHVSLWTVICDPVHYGLDVSKATLTKIDAFRLLMSGFMEQMTTTDAYQLGLSIVKESGVSADIYSGKDPDDISRQENLQEFMSGVQAFVDNAREEGREQEVFLPHFLQEVALLTDLDSDEGDSSKVSLMTIHAAKGLEFPTVFIVGLEENIFPSQLSMNSRRELEEERRLFYVAITRAEKHCILTNAKSRYRYGRMEFGSPSRFLRDIDPKLMDVVENGSSGRSDYSGRSGFTGQSGYSGYSGNYGYSSRMQNSSPVASQFRADPQPKITAPRQAEHAVDPFSDSFKQRIAASGGNLRRISDAISNGGRTIGPRPTGSSALASGPSGSSALSEGMTIEHQRFGIGTVLKIEGTGENTKATVEFRNAGTKQLLLKFARYTIVK